jgi:hypothetical protein
MVRQIITGVEFMKFSKVREFQPAEAHNLFRHCRDVAELTRMRGYYQFRSGSGGATP